MKRNLVSYENFEQMKKSSLANVVNELVEAQEHLARMLDTDSLVLESFDESNVVYRKNDGNFLKANYEVEEDAVTFNNLEELVLDEASEIKARKELVSQMLESILEDKEGEANVLFEKYMSLASQKHQREGALVTNEELDEAYVRRYGTRKDSSGSPKVFVRKGAKDPKKSAAARKAHRLHSSSYKSGGRKRHANLTKERTRRSSMQHSNPRLRSLSGGKQYTRGKKHLNEWLTLTENVFQYADFIENGYILKESVVRTDEKGEVSAVKIPSTKARNEGKILKQSYAHMIKQDSPKVMREAGLRLASNPQFSQAVAELKRHNNMSDNEALENTLNQIVKAFPAVLYLSQEELAHSIGYALEAAGINNFVDQTCNFMAEGILRTAHTLHEDRVSKILTLTKTEVKENEDAFAVFQNATKVLFASLDEAIQTEHKVFEDLYNAVLDVRKIALESQNDEIRTEANDIVGELESILRGESRGNVEFAVDVADWLNDIVEANLPGASDTWNVVKTPHHTVTGDHPQMAKNAKQPGNAGSYPGDWGDSAPMIGQDSNTWNHGDEARHRSWGNKGGDKVYPSLDNPNVPKSGEWTMKGEKGADKDGDSDWSRWQSSDTWAPEGGLQNPYVPKPADVFKQKVDPSGKLD